MSVHAIRTLGCYLHVSPDALASPLGERYALEAATSSLTRIAADNGCTLLPETVTEVGRQPMHWVETGELDDDGKPLHTFMPAYLAPGREPDSFHFMFRAQAVADLPEAGD